MSDAPTRQLLTRDLLLGRELRFIVRATGVPVAFAGVVGETRQLRLTNFLGTRTSGLNDLDVLPGTGLGGRAVVQQRSQSTDDYGRARSITHDYDRPVLAEGLTSIVAVPVATDGICRAVLYAAVRQPVSLGERVVDALMLSSRRLARELAARDDVDRRLAVVDSLTSLRTVDPRDSATLEELRSVHSDLRAIAAAIPDSDLANRVNAAAQRLVDLGVSQPSAAGGIRLSSRETDVLAQVALGFTNAEVAERLSLSRETVKSYLRSAMRKLDASTRHQAVILARRDLLLP